ncbi:MAG: hypothetical protein QOJ44_2439 [Acidimicrobiaceae bacterium]|nr:hypothetical protein [Acidimicrobiaceae bacterium]
MVDIEHENEGLANAERGLRSRFSSAVAFLERLVADLDPDRLEGSDATALFDEAVRIERFGGAARLALAKRIESSGAFGDTGHRSAAELIAERSGSDVGSARGTLELAQQLESCPATADALADGTLSALQAKEIAGAASLDPAKEAELINTARRQPVKVLRNECRRVKATSTADDPMGTFRRIHKGRYLRHWTDEEGAVCLKARLTADRGAKIAAVLDHEAGVVFEQARKAGSREPLAAYAADALFGLLTSGSPAESPHVVVHVRVDHEALLRGEAMPGEISEIAEAGAPLPIPIVSDLMTDAGIKVIFHHAEDISKIYHFTRTINAPLRTALEERDPCCVVPGCGATRFLEIDHTEEIGQGGPTCLANTARLCHFHHRRKTNEGYVLWRDDRMGWHLDPPAPFGEEEAYAERRRHGGDDPTRGRGGAGGDGAGAPGVPPPQLELE